uniref:phosphotransferase n=1 Tax=Agathobacter sp. TaxID=2021311 RepID=UPI004056EA31
MNNDTIRVKELLNRHMGNLEIRNMTRMGGLTNRTYKAETSNGIYVVRLPGEGTEEIIVRSDEKKSTELACDLGIDAKLHFFDGSTGEKITDYIVDSVTMNAEALRNDENIKKCAGIFKTLHTSGADTEVPFDVIEMSNTYEDFISRHGGTFYEDFHEVKAYINNIKNSYMVNVKKVPCHNDALCENWVRQGEKMYLIDWEYAGMNDPMWDLADVSIEADFSEENDAFFLACYFGREATSDERKAFLTNKVLIDYLWSLWGKTRAVYDGEELEEYARARYARMKDNIKKMEEQ